MKLSEIYNFIILYINNFSPGSNHRVNSISEYISFPDSFDIHPQNSTFKHIQKIISLEL
jgi:hypothetical protein